MTIRLFAALLALVVAPVLARSADDDNPFKNVKVGDYATYKTTTKGAASEVAGTITQSVTKKTDKEATVKTVTNFNGMEMPPQERTIDLTKPYDPTKASVLTPGADVSVEKGKDGKEKVKVGGKEYEATWTTYTVKGKAGGMEITADVKAWMSKDVPLGMVKMEMTMELTESGNKDKK